MGVFPLVRLEFHHMPPTWFLRGNSKVKFSERSFSETNDLCIDTVSLCVFSLGFAYAAWRTHAPTDGRTLLPQQWSTTHGACAVCIKFRVFSRTWRLVLWPVVQFWFLTLSSISAEHCPRRLLSLVPSAQQVQIPSYRVYQSVPEHRWCKVLTPSDSLDRLYC